MQYQSIYTDKKAYSQGYITVKTTFWDQKKQLLHTTQIINVIRKNSFHKYPAWDEKVKELFASGSIGL